jgi:hypothetical protein
MAFRILLLLEGNEEDAFFYVVKRLGVHESFELMAKCVRGAGSLPRRFQNVIAGRAERYDAVYCVYDTDYRTNEPNSAFRVTRQKLRWILHDERDIDAISLVSSPNILQVMLLGFDDIEKVRLSSKSKKKATPILNEYIPSIGLKKPYDASAEQLEAIKKAFMADPLKYENLVRRACTLPRHDEKKRCPGTDLGPFLKALKEGDRRFFFRNQKVLMNKI